MMELDYDRIDDAVLALLMLGESKGRAWRAFDVETIDRLHERGFVSAPKSKEITLTLTEEGLARGRRLLEELFGKRA